MWSEQIINLHARTGFFKRIHHIIHPVDEGLDIFTVKGRYKGVVQQPVDLVSNSVGIIFHIFNLLGQFFSGQNNVFVSAAGQFDLDRQELADQRVRLQIRITDNTPMLFDIL
jgi:hypothetical protein